MMRLILCMLLLLFPIHATSQERLDPQAAREAWQRFVAEMEGERIRQERDRAIQDHREAQTKTSLTADQVRDAETRKQQRIREKTYQDLRAALESFQTAQRELGDAIDFNSKLKPSAGKLEKSIKVFLDFLKTKTKERGLYDSAESAGFEKSELARKTLAASEQLRPALASVVAIEKFDVVNATYLSVLPLLEQELLRLHGMSRQLK